MTSIAARSSAAPRTARVDPARLSRVLDGSTREVRAGLRALLATPAFAHRYDLSSAEQRSRTFEQLREVARHGYGALGYPREVGGGGDMGKFFAAFETLAAHDYSLAIKFGVQFGLFGGSILRLGTARHHARFLPDVGTAALPGCFAMSELGHGSNVRDLQTEARYDAATREFVVHTPSDAAHKEWIGNAAEDGRMATVFAQLHVGAQCHGVHAFLVPIRDAAGAVLPGVRIEDTGRKMGLNGVDNGRLWFDRVRIPREHLLNRFGDVREDGTYASPIANPARRFFTMLSTLVGGRLTVAGASVSAAKTGLAVAIRYSAARRQFGPAEGPEVPLLDYLTHQRRLFPALAATYAHDFALKALAARFLADPDGEDREVETLAAGLKAAATWQGLATLQQCRECTGGQGFLLVNRIAQLRSDTDIAVTFEGDNTVLMQLVAKALLTNYRTQFGTDRFGRVVRYLTARTAETLAALNPILSRQQDEGHLRDAEWQCSTFAYRERRLLGSVARRLKARLDAGADTFEAFRACQDHLLALAEAHVERVTLEAFRAAIAAEADMAVRMALEPLAQLYAMSRLEAHLDWYLEKGVFEAPKARAVRAQVNTLCGEIRPDAVAYVDGFGIPDDILAAPIAFSALPTAHDEP